MKIRIDEWQSELERSMNRTSDAGVTFEELMATSGRSEDALRKFLRAIASQGKLVVGRRAAKSVIGHDVNVPVYRIKGAKA